ncbi:Hypothetical predicted protein [Olea europaea subsp. europaea]|uniref:Uncharacterized protein n=1 Tax=Olea europaea subsp. europaea TaxID=158383 RepID=A0A8S0R2K8_OLEEU|nr:Hypothetical predicted protein [Olea europaea subsp. europaea]
MDQPAVLLSLRQMTILVLHNERIFAPNPLMYRDGCASIEMDPDLEEGTPPHLRSKAAARTISVKEEESRRNGMETIVERK